MTNTHDNVMKRLRTNTALEEDLAIANERIKELEQVIAAAIIDLEASEQPFYNAIISLKGGM